MDVTVDMSSTVERVFRKYYSELANAIDSPASFASDFYKEGLISQDSRDAASEVGNTRLTSDKAYQLLNAVQKMVKTNPEKVIRVLLRHDTTKDLGSKIAAEGNVYAKVKCTPNFCPENALAKS